MADAAVASYQAQAQISDAAVIAATEVWKDLDPTRFSASWLDRRVGDQLFLTLARSQELAAASADSYTAAILAQDGVDAAPDGQLNSNALAGVASDGRDLVGLLLQPLITANVVQATGGTAAQAMAAGLQALTRIMVTQVHDAGRSATGIGVAVRPRIGWVRMVEPGACGRCTVLAGRWYRWSDGFLRHPNCRCRNIPALEDGYDDIRTDPMALFNSLDKAEQDRQFTKAGAQAIRDGADISRVVNARRGALGLSAPGRITASEARMLRGGNEKYGHLQTQKVYGRDVYTTTDATTIRSDWGAAEIAKFGSTRGSTRYQTAKAPRLMPESIYQIATSREDAVRLLRRFGYIR